MNRRAGVVTAFVEKVDASQGRVMVNYRGIEDDLLSPWAYVAAPLSGKRRGALFMPEPGDEVLVTFADGDFDHPYVLGFLWNGEQVSPEKDAHNRVIVTPGGHHLRFEDKPGEKRIVLKTAGNHQIVMDDKPGGAQIEISTTGGQKMTLTDVPPAATLSIAPGVSLELGPAGLTINVGVGAVTVNAAAGAASVNCMAANVTASGAVTLTAGGALSVTAGGALNITAGGTISLASPTVMVAAPTAIFSGVVQAASIVSPLYSPGVGNLI